MLGIFKYYNQISLSKAKCALLLLASKAVTASAAASNSTDSSGHGFNPSVGNIIAVAAISLAGLVIVGGTCHLARSACNEQADPTDPEYRTQRDLEKPVVQMAAAPAPNYQSVAVQPSPPSPHPDFKARI